MNKVATNPCFRCGQERIISKSWKQNVETYSGTSVVSFTQTICPDKACQILVEKELASQLKKREGIRNEREQRLLAKTNTKNNTTTTKKKKS